jgi:hypothetical protein
MKVRCTQISLSSAPTPPPEAKPIDSYRVDFLPVIEEGGPWAGPLTVIQLPLMDATAYEVGATYDIALTPSG